MRDLLERALEQLGLGVADDLAQAAIDAQPAAVQRHQGDPDRRLREGGAEQLVRAPQVLLLDAALGDVDERDRDAAERAVGVAQGNRVDAHPAHFAVAAAHAHQLADARLPGGEHERCRVLVPRPRRAVGMHRVPARIARRAALQLARRQPEQILGAAVAADDRAVGVLEHDRLVQRVDHGAVAVQLGRQHLGLAERALDRRRCRRVDDRGRLGEAVHQLGFEIG
jgi:hypothetical protein